MRFIEIAALVVVCVTGAKGQSMAPVAGLGIAQFGAYSGSNVDTVNLMNGNLVLRIPLYSVPQKGTLSLSYSLIMNNQNYSQGYIQEVDGSGGEADASYYYISGPPGPRLVIDQSYRAESIDTNVQLPGYSGGSDNYGGIQDLMTHQNVIIDSSGARHDTAETYNASGQFRTLDGSGLLALDGGPPYLDDGSMSQPLTTIMLGAILEPNGNTHTFPNGLTNDLSYTETFSDPFGDSIAAQEMYNDVGSGDYYLSYGSVLDSFGRTIPAPTAPSTSVSALSHCPNLNLIDQPATASYSWTVPAGSGGTATYWFCTTTITLNTSFVSARALGPIDPHSHGPFSAADYWGVQYPLQSVVLPNGTYWGFAYDSAGSHPVMQTGVYSGEVDPNGNPVAYGDLTKLILPSGGAITYTYVNGAQTPQERSVSTRRTEDGLNLATTSYDLTAYLGSESACGAKVTDPSGNESCHSFNVDGYETSTVNYQGRKSDNKILHSTTTDYLSTSNYFNVNPSAGVTALALPWHVKNFGPGGLLSTATYSYPTLFSALIYVCPYGVRNHLCTSSVPTPVVYGQANQVMTEAAAAQTSTMLRQPTFLQDGRFLSANLLNLPSYVQSPKQAPTTYAYDETLPAGSHYCIVCGTATTVSQYVDDSHSAVTTRTYNNQGMPVTETDPMGFVTSTTYDSSGTFPSKIVAENTGSVGHTTWLTYDDVLGVVTSSTDENGSSAGDPAHTTNYIYDVMGRLTDTKLPPEAGGRPESIICYTDVGGPICPVGSAPYAAYTKTLASPSPDILQVQVMDGFGRVVQSILASDPSGSDIVDTIYDGSGRVHSVSTPYRVIPAAGDPARGVTTYTYDALGRSTSITTAGVSSQTCYDGLATTGQSNCMPNASSIATSTWTDVSDENGNHTQQVQNGLGQLVAVMEPDPVSNAPTYETDYGYDAVGNLRLISQFGRRGSDAVRSRSFVYDGLSHLTQGCNPETSSASSNSLLCGTSYVYDLNGNLTIKTDSRNVSVNYDYDRLNRIVSKSYTGTDPSTLSMPTSCYRYDISATATPVPNAIGRLTAEWTTYGACSATNLNSDYETRRLILAYDPRGHILKEEQCVPGYCSTNAPAPFSFDYSYDLAGQLQVYSNGLSGTNAMTFENGFDAASRITLVTAYTRWNDIQHPATLFGAQSVGAYGPAALPQKWSLGAGVVVNRMYDSRLRVISETAKGFHQ